MSRNRSIKFPCVLKSIIADTHRDDKTFTLNDKQIRSRLRAKFNDTHVKNTSWIATNMREYDALRCAFDARYANAKANARKRSTPKRNATSNDVVETNDA
jgi:hypothetical protein